MVGDLPSIYERSWVLAQVEKGEEGRVPKCLERGRPDEVKVPSFQLRRPTRSFCFGRCRLGISWWSDGERRGCPGTAGQARLGP